jgi:hypothetical protein
MTLHRTREDIEHDAAPVEESIAAAVEGTIEAGNQPLAVRVSVADYRALLARDGFERRSLRVFAADSLRTKVHGFDLPVDADARVPDGDAWCWSRESAPGRA